MSQGKIGGEKRLKEALKNLSGFSEKPVVFLKKTASFWEKATSFF